VSQVSDSVETNHVGQSEHRGVRHAKGLSEHGVNFNDAADSLVDELEGFANQLNADTVADEVWSVFRPHHAFSENLLSPLIHEIVDFGEDIGTGHELEELHVTNRIKEVGDDEVLLEFLASSFAHFLKRKTGGVGSDDRVRLPDLLNASKELLLDFEVFYDNFENDVAILQKIEIILKVTDGDELRIDFFVHVRARFGLCDSGKTSLNDSVSCSLVVLFFILEIKWNDVKKNGRDPGARAQGSDATTHNAGADDSCFFNPSNHIYLL